MMTALTKTLSIDLETYSATDIADAGVHKYSEDEAFTILLFGYSVDYGPVSVVDIASGEKIPDEVLAMLTDKSVIKTAYNAAFERTCLAKYLNTPMPPQQWSCTMVLAAQAGYPLGLKAVCSAMGLPPDEAKKDGDHLIRYFCGPCKPTMANGGRTRNLPSHAPEAWGRFVEYNRRDVEVENTIRKKLLHLIPGKTEQAFWCLDQKINDTGVKLDVALIENAIDFAETYTAGLRQEAMRLSGIQNVKSQVQIKEWLKEIEGKEYESLNKKAMPEVIDSLQTDEAKRFLELRSEISKTSIVKYEKMQTCMCKDQHARGLFQFYGASRTGRFSGRLIQLQNLPQNHLDDISDIRELVRAGLYEELEMKKKNINSTLSELIRTAIIPEDGCHFIIADFSAIEARIIAFMCKQEWRLDVFRNGGDIYCASASQIFGVPVEKNGVNGHLRQKGKISELALGYGGSVSALRSMDSSRALANEPDSALKTLINGWRNASPNIVRWWYSLENAAKEAIRLRANTTDSVGGIIFSFVDGNLYAVLPSGRTIAYVGASIGENRFGNESILYYGQNQKTKKWEQLETYGGKLSENMTQAIARDMLRDAMLRLDKRGFDIRMHVHDEVIINEPDWTGRTLDDVIDIMCTEPSWAKGIPLNAAGFESNFYMKD